MIPSEEIKNFMILKYLCQIVPQQRIMVRRRWEFQKGHMNLFSECIARYLISTGWTQLQKIQVFSISNLWTAGSSKSTPEKSEGGRVHNQRQYFRVFVIEWKVSWTNVMENMQGIYFGDRVMYQMEASKERQLLFQSRKLFPLWPGFWISIYCLGIRPAMIPQVLRQWQGSGSGTGVN